MKSTSNKLSKGGPGGGLGSKVVKNVPLRGGKPAEAMSPCAVAQQGKAVNKPAEAEALRKGTGNSPVPLGNTLTNVGRAGPGGNGRTVSGSGSQGSH